MKHVSTSRHPVTPRSGLCNMIICPTVQRPLSPLVYALDLKSRAFWFFIFTDEKGTPVKIGTTYSLCLNDKKKEWRGKKAGRGTRWTRPRGILSLKGVSLFSWARARGRLLLYIFVQNRSVHTHVHTHTYTYISERGAVVGSCRRRMKRLEK